MHNSLKLNMNLTIVLFLIILSACSGGSNGETELTASTGTAEIGGREESRESAATYYVKAGGNDSLDGLSDATAWATIGKVQQTVKSGDTIYFRSQDTWYVSTLPALTATAGVIYDGAAYGTGTRAKIKATGGYTVGNSQGMIHIYASNVTFRGFEVDGSTQVTGGIYVRAATYGTTTANVTVDNCLVHDTGYNDSSGIDWCYGIHVAAMGGNATVSNISIVNTEVYRTSHEGIAIYQGWGQPGNKANTVLVRNCKVHDTALFGGYTWGDGINVANDADNVTIEYNTVYNTFRGINVGTSTTYVGSPNSLIVRYNLLYENWIGIMINHAATTALAADGVFNHNLILNSGKPWTSGYGADILIDNSSSGNYGSSMFSFYNNTIYNVSSTAPTKFSVLVAQWTALGGTPTLNFKNNIVYTSTFTPVRDKNKYLTHSNNLIYRSSGSFDEHVNNGTSYDRAGVLNWEPTARNADPLFVSAGTNFSLQAGSPAIDAGTPVGLTKDFLSNPVPVGGAPDIGMFER